MEPQADIALIGLAVMGQNLILNMNDHGFTVVAFNRTVSKVDDFLTNEAKGTKVHRRAFAPGNGWRKLKKPRRVMMHGQGRQGRGRIHRASAAACWKPGDIIIDGGNSLFEDTNRRTKYVESKGLLYIGTGVSGGEEGARHGPSIMPGGSPAAWPHVKNIFQGICREGGRRFAVLRLGGRRRRGPLRQDGPQRHRIRRHAVDLRGLQHHEKRPRPDRAGNARDFQGMEHGRTGFSYLIEITRDILAYKDTDGTPLVDKILDTAGQKGTGKWTVQSSRGPGHSHHAHCRGGLFPLRFRVEGRPGEGGEEIERAQAR